MASTLANDPCAVHGLAARPPPARAAGGGTSRRRGRTASPRSAPLVSVLLFLAAIISAFWYLRNEEVERETESLKRDTEIVQQQMRLHLIENQEQLVRMASELVKRETDVDDFIGQAQGFVRERPAVTQLAWLDVNRKRKAGRWATLYREESSPGNDAADPSLPNAEAQNPPELAFAQARDMRQPVYSRAFVDAWAWRCSRCTCR